MKKLIVAAIIVLTSGILSSCTKKHHIQASTISLSGNPFSAKINLATAD
ncbi:MAG: hypothetical protein JWQ79_3555 [Mucilaginibacter sp.]|nr:hypothetical protein [Mucilaginibacter sp.]